MNFDNDAFEEVRNQMTRDRRTARAAGFMSCLSVGPALQMCCYALIDGDWNWGTIGVLVLVAIFAWTQARFCFIRATRLRRCLCKLECLKAACEAHSRIAAEHHMDQCLAEIDRL